MKGTVKSIILRSVKVEVLISKYQIHFKVLREKERRMILTYFRKRTMLSYIKR